MVVREHAAHIRLFQRVESRGQTQELSRTSSLAPYLLTCVLPARARECAAL